MKKIAAGILVALLLAVGMTVALSSKLLGSLLVMFGAGAVIALILNKLQD